VHWRPRQRGVADSCMGVLARKPLSYFQKNIDTPPTDADASVRNVAAMVPMRGSAYGSGGGGRTGLANPHAGNYSGWGSTGRSAHDGLGGGWGSWGGGR
jgi:transcription elongation factor SPT6